MTSVSDVKFGTLVLRAGGAGWLRFILWLNYKIPQKGVIDWLLRENYRGAAVF